MILATPGSLVFTHDERRRGVSKQVRLRPYEDGQRILIQDIKSEKCVKTSLGPDLVLDVLANDAEDSVMTSVITVRAKVADRAVSLDLPVLLMP
jgi:hypothetical protein